MLFMLGLMLLQVVVTSFKSQKCQQGSYKKDDRNLMQKQQSTTAALAETVFKSGQDISQGLQIHSMGYPKCTMKPH